MKMREVAERFRHMLKVKDCRHLCLTCEYYEICNRDKYRSDTKTLSAAVSSMLLKEIYGGAAE
jgi:hypothetical protein